MRNGALTLIQPETGPSVAGAAGVAGATSEAVVPASTFTVWRDVPVALCRMTS